MVKSRPRNHSKDAKQGAEGWNLFFKILILKRETRAWLYQQLYPIIYLSISYHKTKIASKNEKINGL
jgi:hypothetical protein